MAKLLFNKIRLIKSGFGTVEIIVSVALVLIVFGSLWQAFVFSIEYLGQSEQKSRAYFLCQDAIEGMKNIRDRNWDEIENAAIGSVYHLEEESGEWKLKNGSEAISHFTREIVVDNVLRDITGNIVEVGGNPDPNMRKITAKISWIEKDFSREAVLSNYLSNWQYMDSFVYYFSQTNQSDFQAGDGSNIETRVRPGSVILSRNLLYSEDFESYLPGLNPSDWYDSQANYSLNEDDLLFETANVDTMNFGTVSTDSDIHTHYNDTDVSTWTNYEVSGRFMISDNSGGIGITFFSQYPSQDKYYYLWSENDESFRMDTNPNWKADMTFQSGSVNDRNTEVTPESNTWYWFRIQVKDVDNQALIVAKVWKDGEVEPFSWQVDCHDEAANYLSSGTIGLWTTGNGAKYIDDLVVSDLTNYVPSGTLDSIKFDTGGASNFGEIFWKSDNPENTELKFQIRTADTQANLGSSNWCGPSACGLAADYYQNNPFGQAINSVHQGHQWIQYRAHLETSTTIFSPCLDEIKISYVNQ